MSLTQQCISKQKPKNIKRGNKCGKHKARKKKKWRKVLSKF
jgi:hypothetical protein